MNLFFLRPKRHVYQHKEEPTHIKIRTRWAVGEVHLEFEIAMINCLENAIPLLTISHTEYVIVVIEDLLRWMHQWC